MDKKIIIGLGATLAAGTIGAIVTYEKEKKEDKIYDQAVTIFINVMNDYDAIKYYVEEQRTMKEFGAMYDETFESFIDFNELSQEYNNLKKYFMNGNLFLKKETVRCFDMICELSETMRSAYEEMKSRRW